MQQPSPDEAERKARANIGRGAAAKDTKLHHIYQAKGVNTKLEDGEKIDAETAVYFKDCEDCTYDLTLYSAKVFIEGCKRCTFTLSNKVLSSLVELWRSDDCVLNVNTEIKTIQIDLVNRIEVNFDTREHCMSVVWAGAHGLKVNFADAAEHNLDTSYEQMKEKYPDLSPETDQFICRFIEGKFIQEMIVRLPNGYPTTEREAALWDIQQAQKEKAMMEKARELIKDNPKMWANLQGKAKAKAVSKKPRVKPNEPCPCGSGKKYKKCCKNAEG